MKAARIHAHGGPEVIRIDDVPIPSGDTLIKVAATSYNPTELAVRAGMFRIDLPHTLGWDLAGEVDGDPVIGFVDSGAAAEFATAPADRIVPAPKNIPLHHAAAIPLAGLTAYQVVQDVEAGQRVLINGAGGGIGSFAVQLAKHKGAHVIATASPRGIDSVQRYGADEIIDYTKQVPTKPADVMIHLVGTPPPWTPPAPEVITAAAQFPGARHIVMRYSEDHLSTLVSLVEAGVITVDVTESYPLAAMAEVHRKGEAAAFHGKVTIVMP
ncbi:NADP-dependent oxidoreductase [Kibdelosporangium persicum]|uniref:NADP-dependent oxidoreductase n=1 Tax=Kibdelosporangium persicum TaxID=2698649 RepID=A0ABX2EW03_9PSEU|nr:NADP-dependent oxidoreductase [Kibdelosporangium persicum]NRN63144.1 NADP-dependent oxidoreductase [Kibdelosporangium persicum]